VDIVEDQHERFLYCGELREGIAFTLKFPSHLSQGYLAVGYYSHGDMQNGSYLSTDGLRISGHFKSGRVDGHAEMKFEKGPFVGETYDGEYINNEKQGYGIYSWKNGSKYEGNFQKDKRFGKGKMSVANGFHFECEWKNDQPLNLEEATHPQVKQSIQEGVCTLSVTSKESDFPQALYTCFQCGRKLCLACWNSECHFHFNPSGYLCRWYLGELCTCGEDCRIRPTSNKRQKLNTD